MKKNERSEDNTGKVKSLFKDLEYIVFGAYEPLQKLESKRLDIATGGKDDKGPPTTGSG